MAANITEMMRGTGSNFNNRESSTVTAARNSSTVMLSTNMARNPASRVIATRMGTTRYLTALATTRHSQRKSPALAMPSTIIIMPVIKMMVCQLTPLEASDCSCPGIQNFR